MKRYEVGREDGNFEVEDPLNHYVLRIRPESRPKFTEIRFEMPVESSRYRNRHGQPIILVTTRDFENYHQNIREHKINPELQYVELGPGLGGFIPHLIELQKEGDPKPIVIDITNFGLMRNMLDFSKGLNLGEEMEKRLDLLIERCNLLTDQSKVRLVNLPFNIAAIKFPDLEGIADVVVSNVGVGHYAQRVRQGYVDHLIGKMLRPNGKVLRYEG